MPRPPMESVLQVIGGATPLLEKLKAAQKNVDTYTATAGEYQRLAELEQAHISTLVQELQAFADAFVKLYRDAEAEQPTPTPEPTPDPTPEPSPEPAPQATPGPETT